MGDAIMASDSTTPEEGKDLSNHEQRSSPPSAQPNMNPPVTLPQTDPMSLARLRLLSAYSRWPNIPEVDEYRVRWEEHGNNLLQQVARMEQDPASADVTVATKGFTVPAHRVVLAAASKFFSAVLQCVPSGQHPVIVIRDTPPKHLKYVINFCYTGSITIPTQEVQEVIKLAEDLEIHGLVVSCAANPLSKLTGFEHAPGFRASRLFRPTSPKRFTFSSVPNSSTQNSAQQYQENLSSEKRPMGSSSYHDSQVRKRLKADRIEGSPSPNATTPPGSAPPNLPNLSFFGRNLPSPPNSAPPQSNNSAFHSRETSNVKPEPSPLNLVSPSQLLDPNILSEGTSQRSSPVSLVKKEEVPNSPSVFHQVPSTPNSLAQALTDPLTPSTPNTPRTPSLVNGDLSSTGRMGLGCNSSGCSTGSRVLLWRFLLDLLHNPSYSPIYIRWLDRAAGIFRIMESDMVAQLWGMARKNSNMNYEKMSRGMRTYYKRGILFHIDGTKLIYKFNTADPEISQRMRYYDLTLNSSAEASESINDQQSSTSQVSSPTLAHHLNLANLPPLSSLSNIPLAVSSSTTTPTIDSLYSPFQLPGGLFYDPYNITSLLRASQKELF